MKNLTLFSFLFLLALVFCFACGVKAPPLAPERTPPPPPPSSSASPTPQEKS